MTTGGKATMKPRTSTKYCPDCGFKVRGENHAEGKHHKSGGKGK